uniref:NADH-ubiquinone oxidoreductase chain 4 n=1 Tax=Molipteryx lunata TaxID=2575659 RepID=A0A4D6X0B4_9HEMI|nr:NADH dehydrogenase subunit 4 [Molipteryx lunata]QCI09334.1 NADH dehydrogenase subunit 4 [Molipteryx lunata]
MMKLLFFVLFLILLLEKWWILVVSLILLTFYMMTFPVLSYFSSMSFGFGMDLVSYCLVFLSVWIIMMMMIASSKIKFNFIYESEFMLIILVLLLFLILTFCSSNLFMFYLYFESSMIPTLFLIFGWGYQSERFLAGIYLLFYTLFASFPLLVSIFYIFGSYYTLDYFLISLNMNNYLYFSLILAFLIKMPMAFVHFWLPKAHVEAPVSGSMILAGVLLKLGGYGLYRVLFFMNYFFYNYIWIIISLFGSLIVGLLCLSQVDIKCMIAYSSVAHMGLVLSGIMTCCYYGLLGSLVLMIGHGLCSSGLFVLANIIYERSHSRSLLINKGFIVYMPFMSMFWFLFSVNNMASPPSFNLIGEVLLINGVLSWNSLTSLFLALSSFLSCCYSIYLYSITQHGELYSGLIYESGGVLREYILLFMHWLPLNFLFFKIDIFTFWI